MIKKLRLRFIISALISILIVLSATMAAINIANIIKTSRETNRLLDQVVESERRSLRNQYSRSNGEITFYDEKGNLFKESDPGKDAPRGQYFVTVIGSDDSVWYTNFHMVSDDKEMDQLKAIKVYNSGKVEGSQDSFRYKVVHAIDKYHYQMMMGMGMQPTDMEGTIDATYVAFVDTHESMSAVSNYLVNSLVIAGIAYLVIAGLIVISSHFVFRTSEESYRKQKAFVTNASHELKTPLTIINTDLEILEMDNIKNEWTDSIRDQVRRLTTMTKQLVTLSKLDENDLNNYPFDSFSLSTLAKESVNDFLPLFDQKGFAFNSDIAEDIDMRANKYLINELFYIFLDNALKYAKEKGEVYLSVKKNNKNKIEVIFANDIEDDEIDTNQLFERFYRSPSSNKKEGSGIGLSIAKEIIDLHKGKVEVSIKEHKIYFVIVF